MATAEAAGRREFLIGKGWLQAVVLVVLCGFFERPGLDADASGPGIFAEVVSISSTRSAGVSDSAYFIKSIELRPTFDLFLGARRGLHFFGRVSSGEALIVLWFCRSHRLTTVRNRPRGGRARGACVGWTGGGVLSSPKLLGGDG